VLSGAVTLEQLDSNLKALSLVRDMADCPDVNETSGDYWARRSALPWQ
jgi:hypothetical protein